MKKFTLAALAAATALSFSPVTFANDGGYTGPKSNVVSVSEIQGLNDDTYVILKGKITQSLGDEMYVFSDGSGSINVAIDDDEWNGQNVGPDTMVIIKGDIDKGDSGVEIDVDELTITQ